jgi:hypothetical protein
MRTRIALVAIIPIAGITIIIAACLAAASPARASTPTTTPPTTAAPSASTTGPAPTTTVAPSTPATGTTPATPPGSTPSSTVPPYPGLRPISPVLTETTLLVNLNTALHNEAVFHQALLNEAQFLEAMATEAQFHQALSDEARFYETLLSESTGGGSSAGSAVTAMGLPYTSSGAGDTVTPGQRAAWERVAMCEEGGNWTADNGRFSGGLGITRTNWIAYGGGAFAPEGAMATEDEQIMVAERIQSSAPDQNGCHSW